MEAISFVPGTYINANICPMLCPWESAHRRSARGGAGSWGAIAGVVGHVSSVRVRQRKTVVGQRHGRFVHVPMCQAISGRKQVASKGDLPLSVLKSTGQPAVFGL